MGSREAGHAVRKFFLQYFNDGKDYTTVQVMDLAQLAEDELVRTAAVQKVGDSLRWWARSDRIVEGHKLVETLYDGKQTTYRLEAFTLPKIATPDVPVPAGQPEEEVFTAKVLVTRPDGTRLVATPDGEIFVVTHAKF